MIDIRTDRDGLEVINDRGIRTLYLVEGDGGKYTALATMNDLHSVDLLFEYLAMAPRHGNDNGRGGAL
jgi:hypothetical protein